MCAVCMFQYASLVEVRNCRIPHQHCQVDRFKEENIIVLFKSAFDHGKLKLLKYLATG